MNEVRFYQEFSQFIANAGLTGFLADECDQYHILTNSFVQKIYFLSELNPPEVRFNLYAQQHRIPLSEFCAICSIPADGDTRRPRLEEFEPFLQTLTVVETREVSEAQATSLQFPSVHYFSLFIGRCLTARE
jgi:hypothetical protein